MKPTSSKKGRSPWKLTKVRGSHAGGIIIPKGAILVNQGLGKVKLEEDYVERKPDVPVLIEIDHANANSTAASIESDVAAVGEDFTEEFIVAKVEVDSGIPISSEEVPVPSKEDVNGSLSSCREEIESLKRTVKELSLQMDKQNETIRKQNEIIAGMKGLIRTVGLSMVNYCKDAEEQDEGCRQVPRGQLEASKNNSAESLTEDFLPLDVPSGIHFMQSERSQENLQEKDHPPSIANVECREDGTGSHSQIQDVSSKLSNSSLVNVEGMTSVDSNLNKDVNENQDLHGSQSDVSANETVQNVAARSQDNDRHGDRLKRKDSRSESEGDHGCSKCRRKFSSEAGLSLHLRRAHREEAPFKCNQCAKVFCYSKNLNRHILSIHEGACYKCAHCPATFKQVNYVRNHENKVHANGVGTQQCEVCGSHLINSERSLEMHMKRMHWKLFSQQHVYRLQKKRKSLRKRKSKTSRIKLFKCHLCFICFPDKEQLHSHLKESHELDRDRKDDLLGDKNPGMKN